MGICHKLPRKGKSTPARSIVVFSLSDHLLHLLTIKIWWNRPMDLSTIKKNIDSGMIRTTAEFQRDMMLMFINAMMYNSVEHNVHQMAVEMYSDVMTHIEVSRLSVGSTCIL